MHPTPDCHPLTRRGQLAYMPLRLRNGVAMDRPGYIKISTVYAMHWEAAQRYWPMGVPKTEQVMLHPGSLRVLLSGIQHMARYTPSEKFCHLPEVTLPDDIKTLVSLSHTIDIQPDTNCEQQERGGLYGTLPEPPTHTNWSVNIMSEREIHLLGGGNGVKVIVCGWYVLVALVIAILALAMAAVMCWK